MLRVLLDGHFEKGAAVSVEANDTFRFHESRRGDRAIRLEFGYGLIDLIEPDASRQNGHNVAAMGLRFFGPTAYVKQAPTLLGKPVLTLDA
jgi:hypothetical protein